MAVAKLRFVLAVVAVALTAAVLIVTYGRQHLLARPAVLDQKKWSAIMGTNSVFLPKLKKHDGLSAAIATLKEEGLTSRTTKFTAAKFQELAEIPDCCKPTEVPVEDVYEEYNMCQSCLQECPAFKASKCGFNVLKMECLPDVLMEACGDCEGKGCSDVIAFLDENEALNATAGGGDNITRLEIFTELVWDHAQKEAVCELPRLMLPVAPRGTVANCFGHLLQ